MYEVDQEENNETKWTVIPAKEKKENKHVEVNKSCLPRASTGDAESKIHIKSYMKEVDEEEYNIAERTIFPAKTKWDGMLI